MDEWRTSTATDHTRVQKGFFLTRLLGPASLKIAWQQSMEEEGRGGGVRRGPVGRATDADDGGFCKTIFCYRGRV